MAIKINEDQLQSITIVFTGKQAAIAAAERLLEAVKKGVFPEAGRMYETPREPTFMSLPDYAANFLANSKKESPPLSQIIAWSIELYLLLCPVRQIEHASNGNQLFTEEEIDDFLVKKGVLVID